VSRGVLRNHAEAVLADVYRKAIERAAAETGLPVETFPVECSVYPRPVDVRRTVRSVMRKDWLSCRASFWGSEKGVKR